MKRYILLVGIVSSFSLMTCNLDPSFDEYNGESFLDSTSLASGDWVLMPDMDFESDSSGTVVDDYMDFLQVSETGPADGSGGDVYRLEIKNLMPNGDFSTPTTIPWQYYDKIAASTAPTTTIPGSQISIVSEAADISLIHDNSGSTKQERIILPFSSALIKPSTYVANKSYFFHYDYVNSFYVYYIPGWDYTNSSSDLDTGLFFQAESENTSYPPEIPEVVDLEDPDNINVNRITASDVSDYSNDVLAFAGITQGGSIDNFRVIRSPEGEFNLRLKTKLDIDHRSDLELISGFYKFSVWVKQEDISGKTNTFNADRVEIGLLGFDEANGKNVEYYKVFYKTQDLADAYATTTGEFKTDWTSDWVLLEIVSTESIQLPNVSKDPVLELTISPSNPGNTDSSWNRISSGSILIADPKLEYSSTSW